MSNGLARRTTPVEDHLRLWESLDVEHPGTMQVGEFLDDGPLSGDRLGGDDPTRRPTGSLPHDARTEPDVRGSTTPPLLHVSPNSSRRCAVPSTRTSMPSNRKCSR
jgi:hypothetical protein